MFPAGEGNTYIPSDPSLPTAPPPEVGEEGPRYVAYLGGLPPKIIRECDTIEEALGVVSAGWATGIIDRHRKHVNKYVQVKPVTPPGGETRAGDCIVLDKEGNAVNVSAERRAKESAALKAAREGVNLEKEEAIAAIKISGSEWNLGPFPKVHPRLVVTQKAQNALDSFLLKWHNEHDLTSAEYTMMLTHALVSFAGRLVMIERREEKPTDGQQDSSEDCE